MAQLADKSTFFDTSDEPELGDKQKSRSRRSSFRKTLSLITETRRSVDLGSSPLSPASPRHRRSFSFHRRASSSSTSVAEYPQSPSQYYNDPEARMKLKAVVASPESFDQALEHGFPSTTKLDTMNDAPKPHEAETHLTESPRERDLNLAEAATFFDSSSVDSDEEEDEQHDRSFDAGSPLDRKRHFEYQSYPTEHNLESDDDDDASFSENDSPATPNWGDGTSRVVSPIRPELYLDQEMHTPFGGTQFAESQNWDSGHWVGGPREMTLRMTLTKPELRGPGEHPYGWHESMPKDPPTLHKTKDHSSPARKIYSQSKALTSRAKTSTSSSKTPTPEPKKPKQQPQKPSSETKAPPPSPSPGKVRGFWRKVKERKG